MFERMICFLTEINIVEMVCMRVCKPMFSMFKLALTKIFPERENLGKRGLGFPNIEIYFSEIYFSLNVRRKDFFFPNRK